MNQPLIQHIEFVNEQVVAHFKDGRSIGCPLAWFPRLENGSDNARAHYELLRGGKAVHWPELDEDLSAEGFFNYSPVKVKA